MPCDPTEIGSQAINRRRRPIEAFRAIPERIRGHGEMTEATTRFEGSRANRYPAAERRPQLMRKMTALLALVGHAFDRLPTASPVLDVCSVGIPLQARAGRAILFDGDALKHKRPRRF